MTKPLVSVIMPVFNTERRVGEAVESILNQTFFDFEFIIVDDCSSDGSYELLGEYVKRDQRIKLVRNGKNQGISYTRNKLIKLATTNFICTQDSDDISEPKRMERAYDFLVKHEEYAVVS
ncbi:MAG: glycosyltransferase family 2 protein [Candidatus Peribacteria bacterium]|nr:glycosyltransferase family 2 protein [Candidatus Peribacteria bacterium]